MAMELFAAHKHEKQVSEMLDSFVPDDSSLDDSEDEEEESMNGNYEEANNKTASLSDGKDDFVLKLCKEMQLPDTLWWHDNMHPMIAGDLGEILPAMLQPDKPSARPSAKQVAVYSRKLLLRSFQTCDLSKGNLSRRYVPGHNSIHLSVSLTQFLY